MGLSSQVSPDHMTQQGHVLWTLKSMLYGKSVPGQHPSQEEGCGKAQNVGAVGIQPLNEDGGWVLQAE